MLFQGGEQTQSLTQQEYITRINEMSREMIQAWKNDQRVKTLKIVIQVNLVFSPSIQSRLPLSSLVLQVINRQKCHGILSEQILFDYRSVGYVR